MGLELVQLEVGSMVLRWLVLLLVVRLLVGLGVVLARCMEGQLCKLYLGMVSFVLRMVGKAPEMKDIVIFKEFCGHHRWI